MGTADTPIFPLLQVVFGSILEVFLLCFSGFILAGNGVLDKKTQKQINRLNVSLFTPALLFSKVAFFLTPEKLKELWVIPIFFITVTLTSMVIGFTLGTACKLKKSQRSFAMAAAMFMNSNSLPIALTQSLVVTVPDLKWTEADNADIMLGRALTYLVLYQTLGMVVRWSYGVKLLSQVDDELAAPVDERCPLLASSRADSPIISYTEAGAEQSRMKCRASDGRPKNRFLTLPPRSRTVFYSCPNTPTEARCELSHDSASTSATASVSASDVEDSDSESGPPGLVKKRRSTLPTCHINGTVPQKQEKDGQGWLRRALTVINGFMTAPLWAAAASLIVACIPSLQHVADHHMQPLKNAITTAGQCSIPLTLIVLGAYFYPTPSEDKSITTAGHRTFADSLKSCFGLSGTEPQPERHPGETKTVIVSVVSRMFLTPLILLPLMAICAKSGFHDVFSDPVFVVSNVLLLSAPSALTLAQITQVASGDAFERLISRTIFWSYCIVTPPMTIVYVVIALMLAKS